MSRFIIAGTNSGCGKTTVTCAVLSALKQCGHAPASFKCGPDYIDPMFHRRAIGVEAHNLDSFFCSDDTIRYLLDRYSSGCDAAVIEGVMGYYDGSSGSAYSVGQLTDTPAVIVIDCKGMSDSIGAVMKGFLTFRDPSNIAGFIFNRLPLRLVPVAEQLCEDMGTQFFGVMPVNDISLGSRHLGLVTADEISDIKDKLSRLGKLAQEHIRIDKLLELGNRRIPEYVSPSLTKEYSPVIAVARDSAFCFIYSECIDLLRELGCSVRFFSPLSDSGIPDADGLILCGGYPELYAAQLSANSSMRSSIKQALAGGMPFIAECGGFMYLHDSIEDSDGNVFPMVGAIRGRAFPMGRLSRFGYLTMTAKTDNILCNAGDCLRTHEFHYWESSDTGSSFTGVKNDGRSWDCVHADLHCYAGFPHIYLWSDVSAAQRFVRTCAAFGGRHGKDQ